MATAVSRLGKKCQEPALQGFEHAENGSPCPSSDTSPWIEGNDSPAGAAQVVDRDQRGRDFETRGSQSDAKDLLQTRLQDPCANGNLFAEYIGALFENVTFADVPINPAVEFHFILAFAIDYSNEILLDRPRLTIIDRRSNRRILNVEKLQQTAMATGFFKMVQVSYLEDMDMASQIRLMAVTDVLFGMDGTGLMNGLFMPEGGVVVHARPYGCSQALSGKAIPTRPEVLIEELRTEGETKTDHIAQTLSDEWVKVLTNSVSSCGTEKILEEDWNCSSAHSILSFKGGRSRIRYVRDELLDLQFYGMEEQLCRWNEIMNCSGCIDAELHDMEKTVENERKPAQ